MTYNRSSFIPSLIRCYERQIYPHANTEWLILDDSDPEEHAATAALFQAFSRIMPNINYIHSPIRRTMGRKLNLLTSTCKGDIIVVMDDDDYYPPTRISSVVSAFASHPTYHIAGCSKVYMYFTDEDAIYVAGPYHDRHAIHCTMAYRSTYLLDHRYDDYETCAVERVFTNNFTEPMYQLDTKQTILHTVHSSNTFQKKRSVAGLRKTKYTKATFFSSPTL